MRQKGFFGLEIVVFIVGVIAAISVPAYADYTVRARVGEGLIIAGAAKDHLEGAKTANDVAARAKSWHVKNNDFQNKYVKNLLIENNGVITIEYNREATGLNRIGKGNRLSLAPFIQDGESYLPLIEAIKEGKSGTLIWACASETNLISTKRGMPVTPPSSPLATKYAPSECR